MSATEFLPDRLNLTALQAAARDCRGCPLFRTATQTVFGEGRATARMVIVGEQPGHDEDLAGAPFVGPSGRLLDESLEAAGIVRREVYVTNVVKHFKWTPRGRRRLHQKPNAAEIAACMPWLDKEIEVIQPEVLVCLGATASQALLGREFRVSVQRGQVVTCRHATQAVATVHPSAVLRQQTPEDRHRETERFIGDLRVAAALMNGTGSW